MKGGGCRSPHRLVTFGEKPIWMYCVLVPSRPSVSFFFKMADHFFVFGTIKCCKIGEIAWRFQDSAKTIACMLDHLLAWSSCDLNWAFIPGAEGYLILIGLSAWSCVCAVRIDVWRKETSGGKYDSPIIVPFSVTYNHDNKYHTITQTSLDNVLIYKTVTSCVISMQ